MARISSILAMTTEGNPVHQRKRGPGQCVICGETWTDRYEGAEVCGKQKCYYQRSVAKRRTQASENKEGE